MSINITLIIILFILYLCLYKYENQIRILFGSLDRKIRLSMDLFLSFVLTTSINYFIYYWSCQLFSIINKCPFVVFNSLLTILLSMFVFNVVLDQTMKDLFLSTLVKQSYSSIILALFWLSIFDINILMFTILFIIATIIYIDIFLIKYLDSEEIKRENLENTVINNEQIIEENRYFRDGESNAGLTEN